MEGFRTHTADRGRMPPELPTLLMWAPPAAPLVPVIVLRNSRGGSHDPALVGPLACRIAVIPSDDRPHPVPPPVPVPTDCEVCRRTGRGCGIVAARSPAAACPGGPAVCVGSADTGMAARDCAAL